jgi:hypothetical protein
VSRITGIARSTINRGLAELGTTASGDSRSGRVRRPGGGRKKLIETDATLLSDLQGLAEPTTRGDPQAPLLWTSRSLRNLAEALRAMGHRIGHNVVADLLRQLNYSLQGNRKTREGSDSPDRDEQFGYIGRAGNPRARTTMIQLAWLWIRYQPGSDLADWFRERVGALSGRTRRIAIVAMARKLLIALWRYVETGVVPAGVEIGTPSTVVAR